MTHTPSLDGIYVSLSHTWKDGVPREFFPQVKRQVVVGSTHKDLGEQLAAACFSFGSIFVPLMVLEQRD
jgi:hypothetical protein